MSPPHQPRRPATTNNQVVRAHLARKTLPEFLSELEKEEKKGKRPGCLVTVTPDDSLAAASAALAAANILSAPVIDPQGGSQGGAFRGFFDVADYLRAVVELARERCPELLLLPPDSSSSAASAPASSSSLLAAANDDRRRVRDCAHAAGEAWFNAGEDDDDSGGESSMLDVVVSGFRATAKSAKKGSSSAAFLAAAADPLSRPAHRVAVFGIERQDRGGGSPATTTVDGPTLSWRVKGVVSQTDVVRYIAERSKEEFEPALRQSVAELGFAPGVCSAAAAAAPASPLAAAAAASSSSGASSNPLVVLPAGTPALAAFSAMVSRRASAVALVEDSDDGSGEKPGERRNGALLACLTNSDLRGFSCCAEHFAALLRPAAELAAAVAAQAERRSSDPSSPSPGGIWAPDGPLLSSAAAGSSSSPYPPNTNWSDLLSSARARLVAVSPEASLGEALRKAAAARVHRVWVVEQTTGRPVGVVGLTDMLRVLVQEEDE